jgi:hypothetical protein
MVGRVSETARATQWTCTAASTMAADRIYWRSSWYWNKTADSESAYNESCPYLNPGWMTWQEETVSCFHTVRSPTKLIAAVTSRLPTGTAVMKVSWFYCFYEDVLDSYRENPAALGGESCTFSRDPGSDSCVQLYQWTRCIFLRSI